MPVVAFPGTPGAQKPDSSSGGPSGDRSTVAGAVARPRRAPGGHHPP